MCGIAISSMKRAITDITVFAVRYLMPDGEILSVRYDYTWKLGQHEKDSYFSWNRVVADGTRIVYGFHSQLRKKDLIKSIEAGEWKACGIPFGGIPFVDYANLTRRIIVRSVIPKGTRYIETVNDGCSEMLDGTKSLVSECLIPIKIVYKAKKGSSLYREWL